MKNGSRQASIDRRSLYILSPLVLLLIAAALLSFMPWLLARTAGVSATATPAAGPATSVPATLNASAVAQVTPTIGLATPWAVLGLGASATATPEAVEPTALPELPAIALLGPPPASQFRLSDGVTFYWDWPAELTDDRRFAVYLESAGEGFYAGSVEAGNFGSMQQLGVELSAVVPAAGDYQWRVVVEEAASGNVLARSEYRPIVVLADGSQ